MDINFVKKTEQDIVPNPLLLAAATKTGKSTTISKLPEGAAVLDLEKGYKFITGIVVYDIQRIDQIRMLANNAVKYSKENDGKKPHKYIVLDNLTRLNEMCEMLATWEFMQDVKGKTFNRWKDSEIRDKLAEFQAKKMPIPKVGDLKPYEEWQPVTTFLDKGGGYLWLRKAVEKVLSLVSLIGERVIYIAHISDKYLEKESSDDITKQLALTGQLKNIIPSKCDAIGVMERDNDKVFISFIPDNDATGCRIPHLEGRKILFSQKLGEVPTTINGVSVKRNVINAFWNEIYADEKPFIDESASEFDKK